ncbi:MAG TPA: ATP-binding cassette domain-containing protein [Phycisphaerae bacterium]|nr:ATP-binding cassette domain-containing protein [Phycisphaerae bacterium]
MCFGTRKVFDSLSCGFPKGRISVILGGSGSGKSTILRLIGGLIRTQRGSIVVDGEEITRLSQRALFQVRQKLGMVFQGGALLDSYTVFDNLAIPLRERRIQPPLGELQIASEIHAALQSVGVQDVDRLLPGQLSGGMLRRVALARAILRHPLILMCDEPFSGLDPVSIKRIESLLVRINRESGMTLIVVSHHIPSTMRMADHILLLLKNRAVEGSPAELRQSNDPEVLDFLDEASLTTSPAAVGGGSLFEGGRS